MSRQPSPNQERFDSQEAAGTPLLKAVEELASRTGDSMQAMEQRTLGEILQLAERTYGEQLPEFWRIWKDWNGPDQIQPMGDL